MNGSSSGVMHRYSGKQYEWAMEIQDWSNSWEVGKKMCHIVNIKAIMPFDASGVEKAEDLHTRIPLKSGVIGCGHSDKVPKK